MLNPFRSRQTLEERDERITGWLDWISQRVDDVSTQIGDLSAAPQNPHQEAGAKAHAQVLEIVVTSLVANNKMMLSLNEAMTEVQNRLDQIFMMYQIPHGENIMLASDLEEFEDDEPAPIPPMPPKKSAKRGKKK